MTDERTRCECGAVLFGHGARVLAGIETCQPMSADPMLIHCDICGASETPADLTPDWNGETGCHLSCEAMLAASGAPELLDFDLDWSRLTIGDVEVIEDALRSMLVEHEGSLSEGYSSAIIATLGRVEKVAKPKKVAA